MQISFSREHVYTPEWSGNNNLPEAEQFTATLKILDVGDLLFLLDAFSNAGVEGKVEVSDVGTTQLRPILETVGHLLPKYVTVKNLRNKESDVDIDVAQIVEFPYFMSLSVELLMKLAEVSTPSETDEKNLNEPFVSEPAL
jgi:hypothetical protein